MDRWLFAICGRSGSMRSTRAGFVKAAALSKPRSLVVDGARETEMNIPASQVLKAIGRLPEAPRETVLLVYGEDTVMQKLRRRCPSRSVR